MMLKVHNLTRIGKIRLYLLPAILLTAVSALLLPVPDANARGGEQLVIKTNFAEREISSDERIEFTLSRPLASDEGRLAVLIGNTDMTALFSFEARHFSYKPALSPFPSGESPLTVYLVEPNGNWKQLSEFRLRVKSVAAAEPEMPAAEASQVGQTARGKESGGASVEFTPNVAINLKGQNQILTFPREAAPERNPFSDLDGQGNFELKVSHRGWTVSNRFDFVGVSFRQNALRFGELGRKAPQIDLSSYLIEFSKGRFKVNLGHVSFGSNRHLINGFSSRGISVTVPAGPQNEISLSAMNGTSIVGYDNFIGITRRRHSIVGLRFARELFKERPGGLRLEFSVMRGSLPPLSSVNQGEINDAEKSLGFGFKVSGSDKGQRLRYEAGFTRSRFTNPNDPQLAQGFDLTEVRPVTRSARYGEISFDFLQGLKLWKEKKLKVTGTYRHEEIEPLFRSIAAFTQADRHQNQFEITASFGEMNFVYGNLRDRDNLNNLASILKTLNRRHNRIFAVALNSFFTPSKPVKWLPQVSYSYDHTHQFGAFLPVDGEFRDLSQVPDQDSFAQALNAQWQLSGKVTLGYRYSRAFQDNRQPGRDRADFESAVNAFTFGFKPFSDLDLDFDLSQERLKNFEQPRIDRTFRFGMRSMWRMPFLKNSAFSCGLSTSLSGDAENFNDSRNAEFDVQWTYRLDVGKQKYKKLQAQFFVRYANRYGDIRDRLFFVNSFNKTQAFNMGLTFNIF